MDRRTMDRASRGLRRRRLLWGLGVRIVVVAGSRIPTSTARDRPSPREQFRSIATIEERGGRVFRDATRPDEQPVIGVDFRRLRSIGVVDAARIMLARPTAARLVTVATVGLDRKVDGYDDGQRGQEKRRDDVRILTVGGEQSQDDTGDGDEAHRMTDRELIPASEWHGSSTARPIRSAAGPASRIP